MRIEEILANPIEWADAVGDRSVPKEVFGEVVAVALVLAAVWPSIHPDTQRNIVRTKSRSL